MDQLKMFDTVALTEDILEEGLLRGQVGAVVERYPDGEFEGEFVSPNGQTYASSSTRRTMPWRRGLSTPGAGLPSKPAMRCLWCCNHRFSRTLSDTMR